MKRATETPKGGSCKACGGKAHKYWWDCPKLDRREMNYGWKFGR